MSSKWSSQSGKFRAAIAAVSLLILAGLRAAPSAQFAGQTDEYVRYELLDPKQATYRVIYDVSVTTAGATTYVDPLRLGSTASDIRVTDLMTGEPLAVDPTPTSLKITLARPVPKDGQGRIRIEKTLKYERSYTPAGVFNEALRSRRGSVVLPLGYELTACNMPAQVRQEDDGRIVVSFMNQAPGTATLVVRTRGGVPSLPAVPLTNARSWEPPPAQGPTERTRLAERAKQDRDITYFLQDPSTHAFSLFHDYTESREGVDKYINVVRGGSRVSNPSAVILDTGEVLRHETLRGQQIAAAGIDIGGPVTPETEVVVSYFPAVKAGQSVRLRISETYTAPESYRLDGAELVFDRSLGRARNSVVLPRGWYLVASSIPAVISETADNLIRLDYFNGRNDSIDVLIKAKKR